MGIPLLYSFGLSGLLEMRSIDSQQGDLKDDCPTRLTNGAYAHASVNLVHNPGY